MKKTIFFFLPVIVLFLSCNNGDKSSPDKKEQAVVPAGLPAASAFDTTIGNKKVWLAYLQNKNGMKAAVTNYGARMVGLFVPDKDGKPTDVVIGMDNIRSHLTGGESFFGVVVGRYGNRIAKGKFSLDGKSYQLDLNNGANTLHGGSTGFHSRVWEMSQPDSQTVELTYVSADGEEGYPGTLTVKTIYKLTDDNEVLMNYEVSADKKTIANITNHNFWNLNGEGSGTINNHSLVIKATKYNPVDSTLIPTGIDPVAGTPFDFTTSHKIGERIETDNQQLKYGKGYDHNYVLDKGITEKAELIAEVTGDKTGIVMEIYTTEPGIQFYCGNFMEGKHTLKNGSKDEFRTAFCLETQHFPDSPNQPSFPSTLIEPGKIYKSTTICKFRKAQ